MASAIDLPTHNDIMPDLGIVYLKLTKASINFLNNSMKRRGNNEYDLKT